ncbi:MAG: hypothetical protein KKB30_05980 [Proteobacteria bacterium]|nr:hypothetical protein [Pseudomonadota bacterium]MBU1716249.1 hypothetical protein [Pseudomonadota bacterium]
MSDEVEFLPYEVAQKIVGAVNEEEHLRELDRRVLTVYAKNGKELCWFDAEDILKDIGAVDSKKDETKEKAVEYVLHHIPTWVIEGLDIAE